MKPFFYKLVKSDGHKHKYYVGHIVNDEIEKLFYSNSTVVEGDRLALRKAIIKTAIYSHFDIPQEKKYGCITTSKKFITGEFVLFEIPDDMQFCPECEEWFPRSTVCSVHNPKEVKSNETH